MNFQHNIWYFILLHYVLRFKCLTTGNYFKWLLFLFLPESTIKNDILTPKAKALFDFDGEYEDELSVRVSVYCSVWSGIGRRDRSVIRVLGCGSCGLSASPGWVDCVVFLDETLNSNSTSLCLTQKYKRVLANNKPWKTLRWTSIPCSQVKLFLGMVTPLATGWY